MFRPCIDLHDGKVKQIVGSTLQTNNFKENFTSSHTSTWFAKLFKKDKLKGGHVIMLGPNNKNAAIKSLKAYPNGLQIGGGINCDNAVFFLDNGASHIIVTSWIFPDKDISIYRLNKLKKLVGKKRLIIDLSCKKVKKNDYYVAKNKWQNCTNFKLSQQNIELVSKYCDELLIHAVDVEGKCRGIDTSLVKNLTKWAHIPVTYAGGAKSLNDIETVHNISSGKIDLTIGSALDIFGGSLVKYKDAVEINKKLKL